MKEFLGLPCLIQSGGVTLPGGVLGQSRQRPLHGQPRQQTRGLIETGIILRVGRGAGEKEKSQDAVDHGKKK